jgi:hypothetical protein
MQGKSGGQIDPADQNRSPGRDSRVNELVFWRIRAEEQTKKSMATVYERGLWRNRNEGSPCPAFYQFMRPAAKGCDAQNQPLVTRAAKEEREPKPLS